jgi:hypothetical protein
MKLTFLLWMSAVGLRYVDPSARQRPIRSPMDPIVQILEIALELRLVVLPGQPVYAGCCVLLKFIERISE